MAKKIVSPYVFTFPSENAAPLARLWLKTAVSALAIAGFFAILLVFARTPGFQKHLPWIDFFHTALIVHVDLSVLVWMLCIISLMWHLLTYKLFPAFGTVAAWLCIAGTSLIALSAFTENAHPLLNNYIPVLQNITFFSGLSIFACGVVFTCTLIVLRGFKAAQKGLTLDKPIKNGLLLNGLIVALAGVCFVLSYKEAIQPDVFEVLNMQHFYELVFWGGGHVLQFAYTLAMLIAWLWLAQELGFKKMPPARFVSALFIIHAAAVFTSPLAYRYNILSFEHVDFFTQQMRFGAAIAPIILMAYMLAGLIQAKPITSQKHLYNTLLWSVILFAVGGLLGFAIRGSNVIIPAHYHGSIIGVSLALMGFVYLLLPKLGYVHLRNRLARLQPVLYGLGQLLHITGFAISGGYGTLRKTPGAAQTIEGQAALGLMGLGGLISLIGGLLFVIVVYEAMKNGPQKPEKKKKSKGKRKKRK